MVPTTIRVPNTPPTTPPMIVFLVLLPWYCPAALADVEVAVAMPEEEPALALTAAEPRARGTNQPWHTYNRTCIAYMSK